MSYEGLGWGGGEGADEVMVSQMQSGTRNHTHCSHTHTYLVGEYEGDDGEYDGDVGE